MTWNADHHGYCTSCLTNVEHVRVVKSPLLQWMDRRFFGLPELFGVGPWYCMSCGKRRILFPPNRRNAGRYDPNPIDLQALSETEIEQVGNHYTSSVSLIQRSDRAQCYSEKFREGIVERILSCVATFSQVRHRLGITDVDLQDWIGRYVQKRLRAASIAGPIDEFESSNASANDALVSANSSTDRASGSPASRPK